VSTKKGRGENQKRRTISNNPGGKPNLKRAGKTDQDLRTKKGKSRFRGRGKKSVAGRNHQTSWQSISEEGQRDHNFVSFWERRWAFRSSAAEPTRWGKREEAEGIEGTK